MNHIIDEIKKTYNADIKPSKADKAKKLAMDCLVGDGKEQYVPLYDYVAEFVEIKTKTFKIKVNKNQLTLTPIF